MGDLASNLAEFLHGKSPFHRPFDPRPAVSLDCERVAFYLPQFHRCEENDRFWGSGFTEWANVVRALPRFDGHVQPRLPGDLGFYDLLNEDNLARQVEIARNYGLTGFLFYYYWFGGSTVLEQPLRIFLKRKDLRLRFFFMWANENWTRRWDGLENDVLLRQSYAPGEAEQFIRQLFPYLEDERWLRFSGRPLLAVYLPAHIPETRRWTDTWRNECVRAGLGEPYLLSTLAWNQLDPRRAGFDAAIEFPPHQILHARAKVPVNLRDHIQGFGPPLADLVYHYGAIVESQLSVEPWDFRVYRTAFPNWDNTPRMKAVSAFISAHSTPELFAGWMRKLLADEMRQPHGQRMVCVNAWNEWAEGAFLEPDAYFGYAYLDALHGALVEIGRGASISPADRVPALPGESGRDAGRP